MPYSDGLRVHPLPACAQAEKTDMGKNYHPYEGAYMSQVNSIQRHVARDLGIPIIDYEMILSQVCPAPTP